MTDSSRWASESRLRLRRGVQIAPAGDGRWQVRWDFDEVLFLSGESCDLVLPWLIPCLDGRSTLASLEQLAAERHAGAALREILDCVEDHRLLEMVDGVKDTAGIELTAAIEALGGDSRQLVPMLATKNVAVLGNSPLASRVAASLCSQGFDRVDLNDPESPLREDAFVIAVETDCSTRQLEAINTWAISGRHPWMLVAAWNGRVLVGPIFIPGETACYDCYRRRLASHRAHLEAHRALQEWRLIQPAPTEPEPLLPAIAQLAAAHAALELFHFVTAVRPARTVGRVLVLHPADAGLTTEPVLRIPWCEACALVADGVPQNEQPTSWDCVS